MVGSHFIALKYWFNYKSKPQLRQVASKQFFYFGF